MNDALCRMANLSLRPDGLTIRALLAGARYLGDVQLAEGILKIAHRNRIPPDSVHYTTAITACRYAAPPNVEAADEFLQTALAHGATWTPAMVNAAVATYGADVSKALALWKRLRTCEHAPSREVLKERGVYDSLMRVCGRAGRPDLALRIFYAARSAGHLNGNSSDSQSVYNAFRRGVSEGGLDEIVEGNLLKRKYVEHLKLECGVADQIDQLDLPIERIRIKF